MKFGTKVIHAGVHPDPHTGAIMTPIYQTSTYAQEAPGKHKGFEYSRTHNPTRSQLEAQLAALENANYGLCFATGIAAIDAVCKILKPGDEVVATNDLYGGAYRLFTRVYAEFGIKFKFVDMSDLREVEKAIGPETKMIWIETPTNPLLKVIDIAGVSRIAKSKQVLVGVDNTFASPYNQTPMDLGADIVMHSVTKYISGHSDVVLGALVCSDLHLYERLAFIQNASGAVPGPQDCFLALRGIKTLHVRMERHAENAGRIAEFLSKHPKVGKVYYPGLGDHPNHEVAKEQMRTFGGMISFSLKEETIESALELASKTRVFACAESLGGVESLLGHHATMTHAAIPKSEREKTGISDALIRLSIGIEDIDDLLEDLNQAIG